MKVIQIGYLTWSLLLLALYFIPKADASSIEPNQQYSFRVMLDGNPIGSQQVSISNMDQFQQVEIRTSLDVKLLFLSVYQYKHVNTEVWKANCLQSIKAVTDDNGEKHEVNGTSTHQGLVIRTLNNNRVINGCVRSFAYWDPALLRADQLLNAQTGDYQPISRFEIGEVQTTIDGKPVPARQIQLRTEQDVIDLWYSLDNKWLALQSVTRSGRTLRYELEEEAGDV